MGDCPVNGGWSSWDTSGTCSLTCGTGHQTRTRSCDKPTPTNGGLSCVGPSRDSVSCHMGNCPVDGGWSSWETSGSCSSTCGSGQQTRRRFCSNPYPTYGGQDCT